MGFPGTAAMEYLASAQVECTSEIGFFILPWRHHFLLAPFGHPRGTDLGPQMDIEFIRKDQSLLCLPWLSMPPNPGQAFDPLRIGLVYSLIGHRIGYSHSQEVSR
jgi:hypothetical protein